MKTIYVYADFDWLKETELVGELTCENLRGKERYGFSFDPLWLKHHSDLFLSADLHNYIGQQYTAIERDIFGCFSDALPDRWGRLLFNRREQTCATTEHRPLRHLTSWDYLIGVDDFSRIGGFRFKVSKEGDFINTDTTLRIPPLANINDLLTASQEVEKSVSNNTLSDTQWIEQLICPGTSLGGARPKANVYDNGKLYVAKFPSHTDEYDVGLYEYQACQLAQKVGIKTPSTRIIKTNHKYHIFLSERFDRGSNNKRIHFASAMTLLGLTDGDNASNNHGYLDIVNVIIQHCTDVENNLQELYRRVAFNICIGNTDDHFRNHGFLLTPRGWTLSPVYDLNPTTQHYQSLLINSTTNVADLDILLASCEEYMLPKSTAQRIIWEVKEGLKNWNFTR